MSWPPEWWGATSLSPAPLEDEKDRERADYLDGFFSTKPGEPERVPTSEELAKAEAKFERWWAQRDKRCDNCGRHNFARQPMQSISGRAEVCIDCFSFYSGMDPRDPATERTARSGDPAYLTVEEWRAAGKPSVPVEPLSDTTTELHVEDSSGWEPGKPWVANHNTWLDRLLDFLGVR